VISDERMPGRSGTDLLVALRQSPAHRDGGRIIVTAYAGLESAKRAINDAEVARYYPKPWDADGKLLPAVGEILARFAERRGLDRFFVVGPVEFAAHRAEIEAVRRAWWEYVALLGMSAADAGVAEPAFADAMDADAIHLMLREVSPRASVVAAAVRVRLDRDRGWLLDAVVFLPELASEAVEILLIRGAILAAAAKRASPLRADVPILRRDVYTTLGFRSPGPPAEPGAATATMELLPSDDARIGPDRTYRLRYERESRLCACLQTECPARDYAAARRGYLCPLDLMEGRVPEGFPTGR
jgi:hypothetical protein